MGNMHLVTGYAGEEHIESNDDRSLHAAYYGKGEYVMDRGQKFAASIISNNKVRVLDGDIMMQGAHIRKKENTYIEVTIENGEQGYMRNDLIGVTYEKDTITGIETSNMVVMKGTFFDGQQGDPEHDPQYIHEDIVDGGAIYNFMPLYRVELEGLTLKKLTPLFKTVETYVDLVGTIHMITDKSTFSENVAYKPGDYCIYDNVLYVFTAAKEAGFWDPEVVEETTVLGEINVLREIVMELVDRMGGLSFSAMSQDEYDNIPEKVENRIYFAVDNSATTLVDTPIQVLPVPDNMGVGSQEDNAPDTPMQLLPVPENVAVVTSSSENDSENEENKGEVME